MLSKPDTPNYEESELPEHMISQYFLDVIYIYRLIEFFRYARMLLAGYPDFKLCIQFERTRSFYTETRDTFIRYRPIFCFTPGESLDVYQNKPFGSKNKSIPNQLESHFYLFTLSEKLTIILKQLILRDGTGVAKDGGKNSHTDVDIV